MEVATQKASSLMKSEKSSSFRSKPRHSSLRTIEINLAAESNSLRGEQHTEKQEKSHISSPRINRALNFKEKGSRTVQSYTTTSSRSKRGHLQSLTVEHAIELAFAPYAESLRRIAFFYLNRPVLIKDKFVSTENGTSTAIYGQLTQSEAYIQFAKDMKICPRLLLLSEVREAVFEVNQQRLLQIKSFESIDSGFRNLLIICADMICAKKPFCNIFSTPNRPQAVKAILAYLMLDKDSVFLNAILSNRFPSMNVINEEQSAAELDAHKQRSSQRHLRSEKIKENLAVLWQQLHELFLFFCKRPYSLNLPRQYTEEAEDKVVSPPVASKTLATRRSNRRVLAGNELTSDLQGSALATMIQNRLHKARRSLAAVKIQKAWRIWHSQRAQSQRPKKLGQKQSLQFTHSEADSPVSLIEDAQSRLEDAHSDLQVQKESSEVEIPILKPIEALLEWKKKNIDEDSPVITRNSTPRKEPVFKLIPTLNDRIGKWSLGRIAVDSKEKGISSFRPNSAHQEQKSGLAWRQPWDRRAIVSDDLDLHLKKDISLSICENVPKSETLSRSFLKALAQPKNKRHLSIMQIRQRMTSPTRFNIHRFSAFSHKTSASCVISQEEEILHARVLQSWSEGPTQYDDIFDKAARVIQKLARSWIFRKYNREGHFMENAKKSWIEANPPPSLSSDKAVLNFSELVTSFRVFNVIPKIIDEADLFQTVRKLFGEQESSYRSISGMRWEEFKQLCCYLAESVQVEATSDEKSAGGELIGLLKLDKLFRHIFDIDGAPPFDPSNPRKWIKMRTLEYLQMSKAKSLHRTESSGPSRKRFVRRMGIERDRTILKDMGNTEINTAYLNACAKFDAQPVAGLMRRLCGEEVNLEHFSLIKDDVLALAECLLRVTNVRVLSLRDTNLEIEGLVALCNALRKNSNIEMLDLSENNIEKKGAAALASLLANSTTLEEIGLRGMGISDEAWDVLTTSGFDKSKSLAYIDASYNLLSDVSIDNFERLILSKPALQYLDLSFNLFTDRGVDRLVRTAFERSVPRSVNRARAGRTLKQLPKMNLIVDKRAQRQWLANYMGLNPYFHLEHEQGDVFTGSQYITMEVTIRDKKMSDEDRLRIISMCTIGKVLTADMTVQLLMTFFKKSPENYKKMAMQMLQEKLRHPLELEMVKHATRKEFTWEERQLFD